MTDQTLRVRLYDVFEAMGPGRGDLVEKMRALYAPDVTFQDPMQKIHGIEAFLETNRKLVSRAKELHFDVEPPIGSDEELFMKWTMKFRGRIGPEFTTDGVTHVRARDGRIFYHRDHWDLVGLSASAVPGGQALLRAAMRPFV